MIGFVGVHLGGQRLHLGEYAGQRSAVVVGRGATRGILAAWTQGRGGERSPACQRLVPAGCMLEQVDQVRVGVRVEPDRGAVEVAGLGPDEGEEHREGRGGPRRGGVRGQVECGQSQPGERGGADLGSLAVEQARRHVGQRPESTRHERVGLGGQRCPRARRGVPRRPVLAAEDREQPLVDALAATRGGRHVEGVGWHAGPADHVGGGGGPGEVGAGQLLHRLGQPEVGQAVERADQRHHRSSDRGPAGVGVEPRRYVGHHRVHDRVETLHRILGDPPAVDHLPLARQTGILGRGDRQRIATAQLEDGPVDLGARTRGVVQGALELVAEERPELLTVAHAVGQCERLAQPLRAEVDRERRLGVAGRPTVGDPRCAQDPGDVRVLERGCDHEALVRGVTHRAVREVVATHLGQRPTLDPLDQTPGSELQPGRALLAHLVEPPRGQRRHPGVVAVRGAVEHLPGQPRPPLGGDGGEVCVRATVGHEGLVVAVPRKLLDGGGQREQVPDAVSHGELDPGLVEGADRELVVQRRNSLQGHLGAGADRDLGQPGEVERRRHRGREAGELRVGDRRDQLVRDIGGHLQCRVAQQQTEDAGGLLGARRHEREVEVVVVRHRQPQVDSVLVNSCETTPGRTAPSPSSATIRRSRTPGALSSSTSPRAAAHGRVESRSPYAPGPGWTPPRGCTPPRLTVPARGRRATAAEAAGDARRASG